MGVRRLFEMAFSRSEVIRRFRDNDENRIEHLILVYLYPDNDAVNHWIDEICAWSSKSYRVKPNNKFLSAKTIYDIIWLQPKDRYSENGIKMVLKNLRLDKHLLEVDYNYDFLIQYLEIFFKWLSDNLSKYDDIDKSLIKKTIIGLVNTFRVD